jgi:hypothetical protein
VRRVAAGETCAENSTLGTKAQERSMRIMSGEDGLGATLKKLLDVLL